MSTYKTFAVAGGTGSLGGKIVEELVAANYTVKVLSRSSSSTVPNAQVVGVDLEDHKSLTEALKGVDVVINALGQPSLQSDVQVNLAKAAKVANVKLFVPNDWGADLHKALKDNVHPIHAFIAGKPKFHDYLEKEVSVLFSFPLFHHKPPFAHYFCFPTLFYSYNYHGLASTMDFLLLGFPNCLELT